MFKLFFHRHIKKVKAYLPNPNLEYRIVFKKGAITTIRNAKGWKTDAEMARALGLTRSYISMLHKTRVSVTSTVITRLATVMGSTETNWWIYYEIVHWGVSDNNHPQWQYEQEQNKALNMAKYYGQIPYNHCSSSAELRSRDYKVESQKCFK